MNVREYRSLLSEKNHLQDLIARTSEGNVLGRMSLQARLQKVEEKLAAYLDYSPRLVKALLTFRGPPVVANLGIDPKFGGDASKTFSESVATVGASLSHVLPSRGKIPNRDDFRLMITGTTTGSFGFQIEDASQQPALAGQSTPVEVAIGRVKEILEASVGTDEELVDAIADADRRALDSIQHFLKVVADNDATCALEFKGDIFRFRDAFQVRRSQERLSNDNIREDEVTLEGQFQGFLPQGRRAEFRVSAAEPQYLQAAIGTVIAGRVAPTSTEAVNINTILEQEVTITAQTRRVGEGRPRYIITDWRLVG